MIYNIFVFYKNNSRNGNILLYILQKTNMQFEKYEMYVYKTIYIHVYFRFLIEVRNVLLLQLCMIF